MSLGRGKWPALWPPIAIDRKNERVVAFQKDLSYTPMDGETQPAIRQLLQVDAMRIVLPYFFRIYCNVAATDSNDTWAMPIAAICRGVVAIGSR